ncbi:MAG: SRPBCC family protein [Vulcanisaeta sp. AZ3]|jgi:hypothetical protein
MAILTIEFTITREVSTEAQGEVWKILSNIEGMPRYWRGHREVNIVSKDGNNYLARIRFAFPGPMNRGIAKITVDELEKQVLINYINGPIRGYVMNKLSSNALSSRWMVRITPIFIIMKPWIKKHFMEGTTNALTRIVQEAINQEKPKNT